MAIDQGESTYIDHPAQDIDDTIEAVPKLQAAVTGLVNGGGKNRLHIDGYSSGNLNGLTYTVNSDGSITISGNKTNPAAISYTNQYTAHCRRA